MNRLLIILLILASFTTPIQADKPVQKTETTPKSTALDRSAYFKKMDDEIYMFNTKKIYKEDKSKGDFCNYWLGEKNSLFYSRSVFDKDDAIIETLYKVDLDNIIEWEYTPNKDFYFESVFFGNKNVYALLRSYDDFYYDLLCLSSDGKEKWTKKIQLQQNPEAEVESCYAKACPDGFILAIKNEYYTNPNNEDDVKQIKDLYIQKYDFEGDLLWEKDISPVGDKSFAIDYKVKLYTTKKDIYVSYVLSEETKESEEDSSLTLHERTLLALTSKGEIKTSNKVKFYSSLYDNGDILYMDDDMFFYTIGEDNNLVKINKDLDILAKTTLSNVKSPSYFIPCKSGMCISYDNDEIDWARKFDYFLKPIKTKDEFLYNITLYYFSPAYLGQVDGKTIIAEKVD